jgi:hypothetical protein
VRRRSEARRGIASATIGILQDECFRRVTEREVEGIPAGYRWQDFQAFPLNRNKIDLAVCACIHLDISLADLTCS